MKKFIVGILVICCMATCLVGCGKNNSTNTDNDSKDNTSIQNNDSNIENGDSYKVKVNDQTFTFPCDYKKIKSSGFAISADDEAKVLNSSSDYELINVTKNEQQAFGIYIVKNGSDINKAQVLGVILRSNTDNTFSLNGLEIGKATVKEAVDVLGKPEEPQEYDETSYLLTFTYQQRKLTMNFIDGLLDAVYVLEEAK